TGENPLSILMAQVQDRPPALSKQKEGIPSDLQKAIEKLLEKDPQNRFADMAEAKEAIFGKVKVSSGGAAQRFILPVVAIAALFLGISMWFVYSNQPAPRVEEPKAQPAPLVVTTESEDKAVQQRFLRWVLTHQRMSVQPTETELSKDLQMDLK